MLPRYELSADFLPASAVVLWFEGEEALLTPYAFHVTFGVPFAEALEIELDAAVGKRVTLRMVDARTGALRHAYHGIVTGLDLLEDPFGRLDGTVGHRSILRLHFAPEVWRLGLGEHSRVFVDESLPAILRATLVEGGIAANDFELRLTGDYPKIALVCQLRESRLAFLTRWLVRAGATYFFEQGAKAEKLVIADAGVAPADGPVVSFLPAGEGGPYADGLRTFRSERQVVSRRVRVVDYDDLKPLLAVDGTTAVAPEGPGGDVNLFGVNERQIPGAQGYARAAALRAVASRAAFHGRGNVPGLAPFASFAVECHPRHDLNRRYTVVRVAHLGSASGPLDIPAAWSAPATDVYRCDATAVESPGPLPAPQAAWPRVHGTVRARVDGPADSPYAQLDAHGRYLVRLLLDESGAPDGAASCRVRMVQPHGGNPEGFHFPLRKGTEVEIAFLRGDPDQPILVGVVPSAVTPSLVTRANASQNVLQTGGNNRLEIEDAQGSEYLDLSTPSSGTFLHMGAHAGLGSHNAVLSTQGDHALNTTGKLDVVVGGAQTERVTGDVGEAYNANQTTTVAAALDETVGGGFVQTVDGGSTESVVGGVRAAVTGGQSRTVKGGQAEAISGPFTHAVSAASSETITGPLDRTIGGAASVTSPAGHMVAAQGGTTVQTPGHVTLTALGGFNLLAPGGQTRNDASWFNYGGFTFDNSSAVHTIIASLRVDLRAIYVELFGLQLAFMGMKMTTGIYLRHGAMISANTHGIWESEHLLGLYGGGIQAWGF